MAKKKGKKQRERASPTAAWLCSDEAFGSLCCGGYTRLSENPEVMTAVNAIANLISSMTIYLMQNTEGGDVRVKNGLSRKIDIDPNPYMTRKALMYTVVRTLLLEGNGNAVVWPTTREGYIEALTPIAPGRVSFLPTPDFGYRVHIGGMDYDPEGLLHFVCNPDPDYPWRGMGYRVALKEVAQNLKQANATERGFLESEYKPSLVVKVEANSEELATPSGRKKFLSEYLETQRAGEPWIIPADMMNIEQIKPLSLNDLALADSIQVNKKTIASILGVPPYVVGAGAFNKDEWNTFINTTIMPIAQGIQQEMSRKLLYSPDLYFRFNPRSLYAYDIQELAKVGDDQFVRGIMTGNEVRDWLGLGPMDGLDELVILENYIPRGMIGDQKKLDLEGNENG